MPATIPAGHKPIGITAKQAKKFDLQVRSRESQHLQNFIDEYMHDREHSKIVETLDFDYEYRFYTTKVEFGNALAIAAQSIDYAKFKPTAEAKRYGEGGRVYHSLLNSIWSLVFRERSVKGGRFERDYEEPEWYFDDRGKQRTGGGLGGSWDE